MSLVPQRLLMVGCGNMGSALLSRILSQPFFQQGIDIVCPRQDSVAAFQQDKRISWYASSAGITVRPDIILLTVKPQQLASVLPHYKHFVNPDTLFLTVAAGKTIAFYQEILGSDVQLIRLMPNTPVAIGCGQTLTYTDSLLNDDQKTTVKCLLSCLGDMYWMDSEEQFKQATILTGCGPAYVYRFIECLSHAAQQLGLSADQTEDMAQNMVWGSVQYLLRNRKSPQDLRREVTSPGGITEAALAVLEQDNAFEKLFISAFRKAYGREL